MRINPALTQWKLLGNKTGTAAISLPSAFSELLCLVKVDNNNNVQIPIMIPYACLTTSDQGFNGGYFAQSGVSAHARIMATKTSAKCSGAALNGSAANNSNTYYYYR